MHKMRLRNYLRPITHKTSFTEYSLIINHLHEYLLSITRSGSDCRRRYPDSNAAGGDLHVLSRYPHAGRIFDDPPLYTVYHHDLCGSRTVENNRKYSDGCESDTECCGDTS